MRFRPFLIPILATLTCGSLQAQSAEATPSPSPAFGPHSGWRHHHGGGLWSKLNLTQTQKNDLKTYRQQQQTEFRTALAKVVAAKLKLQQDINADDQTAITADAVTLGQAAAQLATVRAAEFNYLRGILNPDQLAAWQALQQQRQTRMQNWINKLSQSSS